MDKLHRLVLAMLMVFGLVIVATGGAAAQNTNGDDDDDDNGDTVTKTFELELIGAAPEGATFTVTYQPQDATGCYEDGDSDCDSGQDPDDPRTITLCGGDTACQGGNTYSQDVTFEQGVTVEVTYEASGIGGDKQDDQQAGAGDQLPAAYTETLDADMVNSASYDFDAAGGGDDQDDQQTGGDKGAGDDQQGDKGAGDDQDDQQGELPVTGGAPIPAGMPITAICAALAGAVMLRLRRN